VAADFGQERPRILAISDVPEVLEKMATTLQDTPFTCHCCATADEAIETSLADPPDLIVCDLHLHGESGQATCEQIKRNPGMEHVPVMYLSGSQLPDVIRRNHADGHGVYCLRKPFAPKVLIELIDQALGVSSH
jgi:CheY-like chemotaxis protein